MSAPALPLPWLFSTTAPAHPERSLACLTSAEADRYHSLRFPRRQAEWLHGRLVAKQLAERCTGKPSAALEVLNDPSGAPYLQTCDGFRLPVSISISHRAGAAASALYCGADACIGIDVEHIEPRTTEFIADYFTPFEQSMVRQSPARELLTALIWSGKEAVLKALGVGLHMDTRLVEALPDEGNPVQGWQPLQVRALLEHGDSLHGWWRQEGEYILTLAIRRLWKMQF